MAPPPATITSRLREYFHTEYQPGERMLVQKIDFFILTFCCLSYFTNYLDRSNLNNAYVSGMKEELGFVGDQLNEINTCFTVGYVVGQVPANLSLNYVRPRLFFPACMIVWAGLTMVTAATHSPQAIMAIRFLQGIAEATTFVGTHYILGAWYTERELGKRSGIFTASGLAGTMIGGFIQTGIHSSLDGRNGLSGWRWLFIIDGIITLPVALYGFLFFPDTPSTTTAFYLTPAQRALAVSRVQPSPATAQPAAPSSPCTSPLDAETKGASAVDDDDDTSITPRAAPPPPSSSSPSSSPLTWSFAKRVLTSWLYWGFVVLWIIAGETESFSTNALLALYMKSHPSSPSSSSGGKTTSYTVSQLNNYPTGVPAVGILSTLFWATLTDFLGGRRELVGYFIGATGVATSGMILGARYRAGDPGGRAATAVVFAAYYWAGAVYACQATFFAWANDALRRDEPMFRAVVLASMNMGSSAVNAWWSIVFYGASMAPWFTRGMWAMIAVSILLAIWTAALSYTTARHKKAREATLTGEPYPRGET
ncbi:major facilitator superfamily domain-containing protein [Biscogniauxia mediterranea]|nr:major facilitator superfamily domain-containing protein [Biscogniauxia mediterranea]